MEPVVSFDQHSSDFYRKRFWGYTANHPAFGQVWPICKGPARRATDLGKIAKVFQGALDTATFEEMLLDKSKQVYQRTAKIGNISEAHAGWQKELEEQFERVEGLWSLALDFYNDLQELDDPKICAQVFLDRIRLAKTQLPLKRLYDELDTLLGEPLHHEAIETYKKTKQDWRGTLVDPNMSVEQKLEALDKIFFAVETKLKSLDFSDKAEVIKSKTIWVYQSLWRYMRYALNAPQPVPVSFGWSLVGYGLVWGNPGTLPPLKDQTQDQALKERIDALTDRVSKKIKIAAKHKNDDEEGLLTFTELVAKSQARSLASHEDFTKAILGHADLKVQIEELRKCSRALSELLADINCRAATICKGDLPQQGDDDLFDYERKLDAVVHQIHMINRKIDKLPLSNKIHPPQNFAERLLAKAAYVRLHVSQFKRFNNDAFNPFAAAIRTVIEYLDPKNLELEASKSYLQSLEAVKRLWTSILNCSLIREVKVDETDPFSNELRTLISDSIKKILAQFGPKTLELTEQEKQVPAMLFARRALAAFPRSKDDDGPLGEVIEAYLLKTLLTDAYFSQHGSINQELEIVLALLERDDAYAHAFAAAMRQKQALGDLVTRSSTLGSSLTNALLIMADILSSAPATTRAPQLKILLQYLKTKQLFSDLDQIQNNLLPHFLPWLHEKVDLQLKRAEGILPAFLQDIEGSKALLDADKGYLKSAILGLYGTDKDEKEGANRHLLESIYDLNLLLISKRMDTHLQMLLEAWALEQASLPGVDVTPYVPLLISLYAKYHAKGAESQFDQLRDIFGIAKLETVLFKLNQINLPSEVMESSPDAAIWNSVTQQYILFFDRFNDPRGHTPDIFIDLNNTVRQAKQSFTKGTPLEVGLPEVRSRLGVARWFLIQICSTYMKYIHNQFELLKKRPFALPSTEYERLKGIAAALPALFSDAIPLENSSQEEDPTINHARKLALDLLVSYVDHLHTIVEDNILHNENKLEENSPLHNLTKAAYELATTIFGSNLHSQALLRHPILSPARKQISNMEQQITLALKNK